MNPESTIGELMANPTAAAALSEAFSSGSAQADAGEALGVDMARMMESIAIGRALRSFGDARSLDHIEALVDGINAEARRG